MSKSYLRVYIETLSSCIIGIYLFSIILFFSLLTENFELIVILDRCADFCLTAIAISIPVVAIAIWNMRRLDNKKKKKSASNKELR